MPFCKWAVEPVFLSRKPLPPDKKKSHEFESVTNGTLVNCLRQLASVAKIADRIFEEIGSEFRLVAERAERLRAKIDSCQDVVSLLNARAVKVPVSDLSETARYLRRERPFTTNYEKNSQLFLPSTRPPCVDRMYGDACTTPVAIMCTIDRYRTDGFSSSELFMVTPVLGGTRKKKRKLLDIETRKPANFTLAKSKQDRLESGTSCFPPVVSPSVGYILKQNENLELERLPSPEEQAMLVSLEYPSTVVPVDTSGTSFTRMSLLRRSLIHADFIIKRKKGKKKSKRRHTFCEGDNREIAEAIRNVTNTSCQTDDMLDITSLSSASNTHKSLSKRRSRSVQDNFRRKTTILDDLDLDSLKQDSKDSATEDDKEKSPSKASTSSKKSKTTSSLRSRACNFNPISSLSAAISIAAVKMRNSTRGASSKQDDGRSSSGNWSASSSTRASVDSDHQHAVSPVDGVSSPSRNSVGKDSVLSDATQQDQHNRSRDEILLVQSLTSSPVKRKKFASVNLPWDQGNSRISKTPTPDFTSQCSSTPVVRSPYAGRRGVSDDGDSSVYSVDTDGYYTSMHTDSGLWCNALNNLKSEDVLKDSPPSSGFRERQESQSSVSTVNSSINSFLSKSATECSSNSGSLKGQSCPEPPPRVSSCKSVSNDPQEVFFKKEHDLDGSDKSYSPHPQNGSASESDHEVRDRIRVKTTITPHRYPSMCAVSPETSDDEIAELKNKASVSNVNVIVAEVHRAEKSCEDSDEKDLMREYKADQAVPKSANESHLHSLSLSPSINMYRSQTPVPSNFSSTIPQNHTISTSTPRQGISISTFAPDLSDTNYTIAKGESFESRECHYEPSKSCNRTDIGASEKPALSHTASDKSLIPLKYAQRITVTPIARSDSPNSLTGTIKRMPFKQYASTESSASRIDKAISLTHKKTDMAPSYVSFKPPDSPLAARNSLVVKATNVESTSSPTSSLPRSVARVTLDPSRSPTSSLPRAIARVTLDPTGKVVYSSNSLGRSDGMNVNKNLCEKRTYATLPMYQAHSVDKVSPQKETPISPQKEIPASPKRGTQTHDKNCVSVKSEMSVPRILQSPPVLTSPSPKELRNENLSSFQHGTANHDFTFRPSRGGRFCRSYFPSHLISSPSPQLDGSQISSKTASNTHVPQYQSFRSRPRNSNEYSVGLNYSMPSSRTPNPQKQYIQNESSPYVVNLPKCVPNTKSDSVLGARQFNSCNNTVIWPGRIHMSSVNNSKTLKDNSQAISNTPHRIFDISSTNTECSSFKSLRPPDVIPSGESPPSTLDITSPASMQRNFTSQDHQQSGFHAKFSRTANEGENEQRNLKSLSPNELFAIIHSSKKKHNIKSESELSMSPLSSRSVSPALSQGSLSKMQPVETGVLLKRNDYSSNDKKWCNSMPSSFSKKQIVQEKIGPTKPTSMHDFKMLLLQTRTGSNESNPRPSAAELLKVSPTRTASGVPTSGSKLPVPSPSKTPASHFTSNPHYSPSHGTVPLKRNMRTRSPYLTRYDSAYPPIMEDCSEEMESYEDSKCLVSSPQTKNQMYNTRESFHRSSIPASKPTSTWV